MTHATRIRDDAGPLGEIERRVRARANALALDTTTTEGDITLHELIGEEIDAWQEEHRRGTQPHAISDPERIATRALHNLARYGPLTELLDDPDVWEIMVNSPNAVFAKRHQGHSGLHPEVFHDDDHVDVNANWGHPGAPGGGGVSRC